MDDIISTEDEHCDREYEGQARESVPNRFQFLGDSSFCPLFSQKHLPHIIVGRIKQFCLAH